MFRILNRIVTVGIVVGVISLGWLVFAPVGADEGVAGLSLPTASKVPPVSAFPKSTRGKVTGGAFSLVDHEGRSVSDADFRGQFMLVYFGYTSCPDVCPTDLQVMGRAMDILGEAGDKVQPLFITFDPDRDTPKVMADYVSNFHPRILGLTGTKEQTLAAANAYDVDVSATYAANDPSGMGYSMNHSAFTYLSGPDGRVRMMFRDGIDGKTMAAYIRKTMNKK